MQPNVKLPIPGMFFQNKQDKLKRQDIFGIFGILTEGKIVQPSNIWKIHSESREILNIARKRYLEGPQITYHFVGSRRKICHGLLTADESIVGSRFCSSQSLM